MKKVKFFCTVIKIFMKNQMQNKGYIFLDLFNMVSRCLVLFFLYSYIFHLQGGSIKGISYETTLWSMFIYFCIMTLNIRKIYKLIMDDVKSGNIEMFMNKPVSYIVLSFCKIIGQGIYSFLIVSVFGSIVMSLFVGFPEVNLFLWIPSMFITVIFGQILALIIYSIIGILSLFMQDVRAIYWITDKFVMILGGSYLPISMFPIYLKVIAYMSPFGAINFASSTVYASWNNEFIIRILLQLGWIVLFGVLLKVIFNKAKQKAMINGG
ncbi:MAG: ABC transporter permease [Bacilli bacterium]|nr:ABC transporter permease [Bacilli bacterium]